MDLKDMIVAVVYPSPEGLVPMQIVEAVLQIVQANPKLLIEVQGKI